MLAGETQIEAAVNSPISKRGVASALSDLGTPRVSVIPDRHRHIQHARDYDQLENTPALWSA
jgi:hypothetical protein